MFKSVFNFSNKHSAIQSVFFYVFWVMLFLISNGILTAMFLGATSSLGANPGSAFGNGFEFGSRLGVIAGPIFCVSMSVVLIYKKRLPPPFYFLALFSGILALISVLIGFIVVSFIYSMEKREQIKEIKTEV